MKSLVRSVLTIVPPDGVKNDPLRSISVDVVAELLFLTLAEVVFLRPVSVAFLFFLEFFFMPKLKFSCCLLRI